MDFDGMTREQLIIELAAKSKECEALKKQVEEEQEKLLEERSNLLYAWKAGTVTSLFGEGADPVTIAKPTGFLRPTAL